MSQMDFMEQLRAYDKDNIKPIIIKKLDKYYKDPRFLPDLVNKQSSAAMCLCMWVRAMVVYDSVAKGIEPKKIALKEAEEMLQTTIRDLSLKRSDLQEVLNRVAGLVRTLKATEEKKGSLEIQASKAEMHLVRSGVELSYYLLMLLISCPFCYHYFSHTSMYTFVEISTRMYRDTNLQTHSYI